ncbi:thermonuclease family protein [Brooklawnia cerclae]|nr:thermonuclease family protein [Brooklawnia cerclae]
MKEVQVVRVVDGDTIDVLDGSENVRVRLLNVDTPESVDPDKPVECGAEEASKFLAGRLPPGSNVSLGYDRVRVDGYGRVLAGVISEGSLVNAEIALKGLGRAVVFSGNEKYYPEVLAAQEEARRRGAGLYSTQIECSLPSQIASLPAQELSTVLSPEASLEELVATLTEIDAALVGIQALRDQLAGDSSVMPLAFYTTSELEHMRFKVVNRMDSLQSARDYAGERVETMRSQAAALEAEEAAKQERENQAREAGAAAQPSNDIETVSESEWAGSPGYQQQAVGENETVSGGGTVEPTAPATSAGVAQQEDSAQDQGSTRPPNAAPCRSYAPGGKTFVYIDCVTKQPI